MSHCTVVSFQFSELFSLAFFVQLLFIHDKKVVVTGASVNQERTLLGELTGQLL